MQPADGLGVIFDLDGVLVDSADAHHRSWNLLADELGMVVPKEQFSFTFGRQNRDIIPLLFGETNSRKIEALSDRKESLYRGLIRGNPPIVEGAMDLVWGLHRAGARLAIGSSGPMANIELILSAMSARACFQAIVSAEDVTRGKPDPQVFDLACRRLGLTPGRCVVIEDAPAGVEAAKACGAKVVAVLMHHPSKAFLMADRLAARLIHLKITDLLGLLESSE